MKKIIFASFVFTSILNTNAQTIRLTSATPNTTALGNNNSVIIGTGAGNSIISTKGENVFIGTNAGNKTTGESNTFIGWASGPSNTTGIYNTFIGRSAGNANVNGVYNTYLGALVGLNSTSSNNTFLGFGSGGQTTTGGQNTFVGALSGANNTTGLNNVLIGHGAGEKNGTGYNNAIVGFGAGGLITNQGSNSILGWFAGREVVGGGNVLLGEMAGFKASSNNVMIGNHAGENAVAVDHQLYIDNTNTSTPLIWGDFWHDQLKFNGKVGIGNVISFSANPEYNNYKLFVTGGILTDEIRVKLSTSGTWADYVFAKDYILKPLAEVESFITENGHLPNVPSASQVKEDGINVADMIRIQQEKIEELTLYIIEQNKRIEKLEAQMKMPLAKINK